MSSSAMHVATTGLNAQQLKMQIIANNLANVNTNGFKRDRANFESLLYQVMRSGGAQTSDGTMLTSSSTIGTGVRLVSTDKLYTQGSLTSTENSMDMAIDGQGFFQVLLPDGRMGYTRNGAFSRDANGTLTTASGYVVQPEIQIPDGATEINVGANGVITVLVGGSSSPQEVGQLTLVDFTNPRGLQPIGENFVVETPASGTPIEGNPFEGGFGKITQGYLEGSNVNVVQQLVDMIETQRAYEVSSKSITAVDEMMKYISNNL
jgi:flagellar basal-body rod protein FlgG